MCLHILIGLSWSMPFNNILAVTTFLYSNCDYIYLAFLFSLIFFFDIITTYIQYIFV